MAYIVMNADKLRSNYRYLDDLFNKKGIKWAVVTKLLCGNKDYISEIIKFGVKQICDSRVSNLKTIKQIDPTIETIYIKPPAKRAVKGVVKYADISMNTEIKTIQLLSREAVAQNKMHRIIIMIELGELREGVMGEDFIRFYEKVFDLENIEVVGIGTNLSCLYGVLPNQDKLIQLSLYAQLVEAKFQRKLQFISGGSSVTIPLIFEKRIPGGINHFRVGETLFLGTDVYNNTKFRNMCPDVFQFYAEIIELTEKPVQPIGDIGTNVEGQSYETDKKLIGKHSCRAIIDIGLLDVEQGHIEPADEGIEIVGASSDMIVVDLKDNSKNCRVGDLLEFKLDYMGTLKILNSRYVDKRLKYGS